MFRTQARIGGQRLAESSEVVKKPATRPDSGVGRCSLLAYRSDMSRRCALSAWLSGRSRRFFHNLSVVRRPWSSLSGLLFGASLRRPSLRQPNPGRARVCAAGMPDPSRQGQRNQTAETLTNARAAKSPLGNVLLWPWRVYTSHRCAISHRGNQKGLGHRFPRATMGWTSGALGDREEIHSRHREHGACRAATPSIAEKLF